MPLAIDEDAILFRALFDAMPQLAFVARPDGRIDRYNLRWHEYTGAPNADPHDLGGWGGGGGSAVHPEHVLKVIDRYTSAIATREAFEIEFPLRGKTGEFRRFLTRVSPVWNDAGELVRWVGTQTDIEDQKVEDPKTAVPVETLTPVQRGSLLLPAGLASGTTSVFDAAEGRVSLLLMQVPMGVAIMNGPKHVFVFVNDAWRHMVMTRDFIGRPFCEAIPEAVDAGLVAAADDVWASGIPKTLEGAPMVWDRRDTGTPEERLYSLVYQPIRNAEGRIEGVGIAAYDVTDQGRAHKESERVSALKDEFVATVSHELRTPLTAILGWIRMLRSGTLSDAKKERAVQAIERNAVAQAQLVDDLLDISGIIAGKLRLEVQEVEPAQFIEAAIDSVRPSVEAKNITLRQLVDPRAGAVLVDPARLRQIAWNLLSNAVKFTPSGGRVSIALERIDSNIELAVKDNGQGIDPSFLPHVFDRFRQQDPTASRMHPGLGLGLAIAKQLVEMQGGTLTASSGGDHQGSTFTVRFPLAPTIAQRTSRPPPTSAPVPLYELPSDLAGLKVLAVDDEADARELIESILDACGCIVTTVASAAEAMRVLAAGPPDLLLADIALPEEDGYVFIAKVREDPRWRDIPAAAVTGYARAEDRRRALAAGYQMHVPKPVEPTELVAVVSKLGRFARALA